MRRKIIVLTTLIVLASASIAYSALFGKGYHLGNFNFSQIEGKVYVIDYGDKQNIAVYLYRRVALGLFTSGGIGKYEESLHQWKNFVRDVDILDQQIDEKIAELRGEK